MKRKLMLLIERIPCRHIGTDLLSSVRRLNLPPSTLPFLVFTLPTPLVSCRQAASFNTARGLGSAVSSCSGSGAKPQSQTLFTLFQCKITSR
jgi:hypothetical protein